MQFPKGGIDVLLVEKGSRKNVVVVHGIFLVRDKLGGDWPALVEIKLETVKVIFPQFRVVALLLPQVVGNNKQTVGYGDNGPLPPPAGGRSGRFTRGGIHRQEQYGP